MGLYFQWLFKRHSFLARFLAWMQATGLARKTKSTREAQPECFEFHREFIFSELEQATSIAERTELVRTAIAQGISLAELERQLDWLDAKRKNENE